MDTSKRRLLRNGQPVRLTSKVFDTLLVLLQNSGRVVEKDELMEMVWPDTVVEENNLNVNISVLRKALGEVADERRIILTIPGRGYRFATTVKEVWDERADQAGENPELAGSIENRDFSTPRPGEETSVIPFRINPRRIPIKVVEETNTTQARSIAVLPFRRLGGEETDDYLGVGLADALITRISGMNRMLVRPTSSILKYDNSPHDATKVGTELRVNNVLEGSFRKVGDQIKVTVQVVSVIDGAIVWGHQFNEAFTDILAVEDSITEHVAAALVRELTREEIELLRKRDTQSNTAHHQYLKGRYHWNKRTADGLKEGMHFFLKALEEDPGYALAHSGLADSYIVLGNQAYLPPKEAFVKAKEGATQALNIDDRLPEAHASLGYVNWAFDWNWNEAELEYQKSISLNPGYATTHQWYSLCLASLGRTDEAIKESERARETDPVSLIGGSISGIVFYLCHQYDRAIDQCLGVLALDPGFYLAHLYLGWAYEQKGMNDQAIAAVQQSITLSGGGLMPLASLGYSYGISGRLREAQGVLERLDKLSKQTYVPAVYPATIYASIKRNNDAFEALERAYEERSNWLPLLNVDPKVDSLRSDPRFADLLHKVGFVV